MWTQQDITTLGLCIGGIIFTLFYIGYLRYTLWEKRCCGKTPKDCRCCHYCKAVDRRHCVCRHPVKHDDKP